MANVVESACVYNSRDQPSAPVLLLLCSSSPPPSVCTCCSLPMKGALKAVHLREAVRADVVLWKHEKQVCKSELWQHYPKVLPPSLFPSFPLSVVSPCSTGCLGIFCVLHWTQTCHLPVSPSPVVGLRVCATIPGSHFKSYSAFLMGKRNSMLKTPAKDGDRADPCGVVQRWDKPQKQDMVAS